MAYTISGYDYYAVTTGIDFAVLEWYGGHDVDRGDLLIGKMNAYGMRDIFDFTADQEVHVWVEDYSLDKEKALEVLTEHCH